MPKFEPPKKFTLLPKGKAVLQITRLITKGLDTRHAGASLFIFELKHEGTGSHIQERLTECESLAWKMNDFANGFRITEHFGIGLDQGWSFDADVVQQNDGWIFVDPAACVGLRAAVEIEHRPDPNKPSNVYNQIVFPEIAPKLPCTPETEKLRAKVAPENDPWK